MTVGLVRVPIPPRNNFRDWLRRSAGGRPGAALRGARALGLNLGDGLVHLPF